MAVHQGRARPRQRLFRLSAARRQLGLEQCRPDRRSRPDPAGRHAVRPQAHARDAGAAARRGAGRQVDRPPGQHPFQRRPHLRQPARQGRGDHRLARLRRRDEGAAGRGAGRHAAQLAPARRGRRLPARGDGQQIQMGRRDEHAADTRVRRRAQAQGRRQGRDTEDRRAGAHARRRAGACPEGSHRLHRRHPVRRGPSRAVGWPGRQLGRGLRPDHRLGRRATARSPTRRACRR